MSIINTCVNGRAAACVCKLHTNLERLNLVSVIERLDQLQKKVGSSKIGDYAGPLRFSGTTPAVVKYKKNLQNNQRWRFLSYCLIHSNNPFCCTFILVTLPLPSSTNSICASLTPLKLHWVKFIKTRGVISVADNFATNTPFIF